ncbi:ABC transporter permease [Sediminispirochaeta smaragdinae]|uniref:Inner-membrane translocator n=1 Tax=Sediminispirochaeta smaragdinae (strain DSM 11293 / JCM 15392 / SEBR 4228) TaxID=573413 RepID=E1R9Q3_SEDSS|nr:ABC transporter permease [Sediminispirochaeta smaragdinae]ADK83222.1 inner-membrane translocator [Sediminispirochaeta smaragdinae DSM 11293]
MRSYRNTLLIALVLILAISGTVLYLGSYFWGGLLIMAAGVLYLVNVYFEKGKAEVLSMIRRYGRTILIPIIGILASLLLGIVIMLATGYDPIRAFKALFYGGFVKNWHISVLNAAPLIFTGLSVAFAFQAGLFNIGAEGQYYIGAMAAAWLGLVLNLPALITLILIFVVAGILSAAWNFVPALLKVKTGAHEVITTMMLAHVARYLSPIFIRAFGGDPSSSKHPYVTDTILESAWLPRFQQFLPKSNYRLHTGIIIAIAMAFVVYYILYKTKYGFEIRAVGANKDAARAQGISIGKNIFRALLFAGFLAGFAGVNQVVGLDHKLFENLQANYGWNGISVALLAGNNPIVVIFTGLLWGALDAGGQYMARTTQTPNAIVEIVKGVMLFLIVAKYIYVYIGNSLKRRSKTKAAPDAAKARG